MDTPLLAGGLDDPVLGPLIEALPVPMGRRANATEIAAAIGFLLDPANGYIHGSVLFVDGGSDALLRPRRICEVDSAPTAAFEASGFRL